MKEVETLRKMSRSLRHLPRLLETFDRLRFRLMWLLREEETVPYRLIPGLTPRKVVLTEDVLSAVERRIIHRNQSTEKVSTADSEL
jgi:hypothetical protein